MTSSNLIHLKEARHYHGLTKRELGVRMRVDVKTIHNWELGKTSSSTKYLDIIQNFISILEIEQIANLNSINDL